MAREFLFLLLILGLHEMLAAVPARAGDLAQRFSKAVDAMADDFTLERKGRLSAGEGCEQGALKALETWTKALTTPEGTPVRQLWEQAYAPLNLATLAETVRKTAASCRAVEGLVAVTTDVPAAVCFNGPPGFSWEAYAAVRPDALSDVAEILGHERTLSGVTATTDPQKLASRLPADRLERVTQNVYSATLLFKKLGKPMDAASLSRQFEKAFLENVGSRCTVFSGALARLERGLAERERALLQAQKDTDEARRQQALKQAQQQRDRLVASQRSPQDSAVRPPPPQVRQAPGYWRNDPKVNATYNFAGNVERQVLSALDQGRLNPGTLDAATRLVQIYQGRSPRPEDKASNWSHDDRALFPLMKDQLVPAMRYLELNSMVNDLAGAYKKSDTKRAGLLEQYIRHNIASFPLFVPKVDGIADHFIEAARSKAEGLPEPAAPAIVRPQPDKAIARTFPWAVDLRGLARARGDDRFWLAKTYAEMLLTASRAYEPQRVVPIAQWLLDQLPYLKPPPIVNVGVHGSLRVATLLQSDPLEAAFAPATPYPGAAGGWALIERGPDLKVRLEYLEDGSRLKWALGTPSRIREGKDGGIVSNETELRKVYVAREKRILFSGERTKDQSDPAHPELVEVDWIPDGALVAVDTIKREVQGTSFVDEVLKPGLNSAGTAVTKMPVIGPATQGLGTAVQFLNWTGNVFFDGAVGASQHLIGRTSNDPFYRMEGLGTMVKAYADWTGKDLLVEFKDNLQVVPQGPKFTLATKGRPKILDLIAEVRKRDPAVLKELDIVIFDARKRLLEQIGYTKANLKEKKFGELVYGPIDDEERAVALLRYVGTGTYGARITQLGAADKSNLVQFLGGGYDVLEAQGRSLPMLLAMYGLSNLSQAASALKQTPLAQTAPGATRLAAAVRNGTLVTLQTSVRAADLTFSKYMDVTWKAGLPGEAIDLAQSLQSHDPARIGRALANLANNLAPIAHGRFQAAKASEARTKMVAEVSDVRDALSRIVRENSGNPDSGPWEAALDEANRALAQLVPYEEFARRRAPPTSAPAPDAPAAGPPGRSIDGGLKKAFPDQLPGEEMFYANGPDGQPRPRAPDPVAWLRDHKNPLVKQWAGRLFDGRPLTPTQAQALTDAHEKHGDKGYGEHSTSEAMAKMLILIRGGFSPDQAFLIVKTGIAGQPGSGGALGWVKDLFAKKTPISRAEEATPAPAPAPEPVQPRHLPPPPPHGWSLDPPLKPDADGRGQLGANVIGPPARLGAGVTSVVFRVEIRLPGGETKAFALKVPTQGHSVAGEAAKIQQMLRQLGNPRLTEHISVPEFAQAVTLTPELLQKLHGIPGETFDPAQPALLLPLAEGSDLLKAVEKDGRNVPSGLMEEIRSAVYYLQEKGISHSDPNPKNWMISADGNRLVLVDFAEALMAATKERLPAENRKMDFENLRDVEEMVLQRKNVDVGPGVALTAGPAQIRVHAGPNGSLIVESGGIRHEILGSASLTIGPTGDVKVAGLAGAIYLSRGPTGCLEIAAPDQMTRAQLSVARLDPSGAVGTSVVFKDIHDPRLTKQEQSARNPSP